MKHLVTLIPLTSPILPRTKNTRKHDPMSFNKYRSITRETMEVSKIIECELPTNIKSKQEQNIDASEKNHFEAVKRPIYWSTDPFHNEDINCVFKAELTKSHLPDSFSGLKVTPQAILNQVINSMEKLHLVYKIDYACNVLYFTSILNCDLIGRYNGYMQIYDKDETYPQYQLYFGRSRGRSDSGTGASHVYHGSSGGHEIYAIVKRIIEVSDFKITNFNRFFSKTVSNCSACEEPEKNTKQRKPSYCMGEESKGGSGSSGSSELSILPKPEIDHAKTKKEKAKEYGIQPCGWLKSLLQKPDLDLVILDDVFNSLKLSLISCPCKDCPYRSMHALLMDKMCKFASACMSKAMMKRESIDQYNQDSQDSQDYSCAYRDLSVYILEIITRTIEASLLDGTEIDIGHFRNIFPQVVQFVTQEKEKSSVQAIVNCVKRIDLSDYKASDVEKFNRCIQSIQLVP